ncbi:9201_t:CDS:2 [Funneliformis mosseae]|uniref:9201_t:CDS:1 n=1 Tax=Funneliformis mosseae TaxID=27381 RepID=A0A9N9D4T1_FUNMO|nr:9201_t:CDS:2 [Funneliformis mosseae]
MSELSDIDEIDAALFEPSLDINIKEVHYSTVPIEYPKTSELGVATAYNIIGWKNPKDCWKNVRSLFKFYPDPTTYDISLLKELLSGNAIVNEQESLKYCTTIAS